MVIELKIVTSKDIKKNPIYKIEEKKLTTSASYLRLTIVVFEVNRIPKEWWIDTRATYHACYDKKML